MSKLVRFTALFACVAILGGCATSFPVGVLYTELELPITATSNSGEYSKVGRAECTSVLGLVATGEASIEAAKEDGGITEVHHVDWHVENILGIIGKYECVVYGN